MTPRPAPAPVPAGSAIAPYLADAYFHDTWAVRVSRTGRTALALYLHMAARTPAWVNALMTVRNRVVAACGGRDAGYLGDLDRLKPAAAYRVGDAVGVFDVAGIADDEVLLLAGDRHLDARMSVCTRPAGAAETVAITTVVHVHNAAGRLYMAAVAPVHRFVVPALLARLREFSRGQTP